MALNLQTQLQNVEFRILIEDKFKDKDSGNMVPYMTLVVEDDKCTQTRISVPEESRSELRSLGLVKGCYVDVTVDVRAGANYSSVKFVRLDDVRLSDDSSVTGF